MKEGTEGNVDITATSVDAIGETNANTFTPEKEKEKETIWIKNLSFMKNSTATNVSLKHLKRAF